MLLNLKDFRRGVNLGLVAHNLQYIVIKQQQHSINTNQDVSNMIERNELRDGLVFVNESNKNESVIMNFILGSILFME